MKTRHEAAPPAPIQLRRWWELVDRVFWRVLQDNRGLLVTDISFWACFLIFQAIAAAPMDWRVFTDTIPLRTQLETVRELAPDIKRTRLTPLRTTFPRRLAPGRFRQPGASCCNPAKSVA
jgi:hypothetical protein